MSWSSFGRRASTATFLTLWLSAFSGCSRDSQTPPDPAGTYSSGSGVEATAPKTLSARQVLENKWKTLSKQVASGTGRAREKARRIRSFVVEAENIKSSEKLSRLPVLDQAKMALKRAENDFDLEWRGEFAGLEEVVMKILA